MCTVSDKVKFCTCPKGSRKPANYWKLYRFAEKNTFTIGDVIFQDENSIENFELNKQTLETRLNEPDAFDQPFAFQEKDRLEIFLKDSKDPHGRPFSYLFIYHRAKWKYRATAHFELANDYVEVDEGKVENG